MNPRRATGLTLVLVASLLLLGARLTWVQVVDAEELAAVGEQQRARTVDLPASRGDIRDRAGALLATDVPGSAIYVDPLLLSDTDAALALLDDLGVDVDVDDLEGEGRFRYLARQQPPSVGDAVVDAGIRGLGVLDEPRRTYPAEGTADAVLGAVNIDGDGIAGIELALDSRLSGSPGRAELEVAPGGRRITATEVDTPQPGARVQLTIDQRVQHATERVLADGRERKGAQAAAAIVLEVGTGDILAVASDPDGDGAGGTRLRALTDQFEPGSTQKPATIAAALDHGVIADDLSDTFEVPPGLTVANKTFTDVNPSGTRTMDVTEILARSSNVGTIRVAQRLDADELYDSLTAYGYGEPTGVRFPGEVAGTLPHPDSWWATSKPTIAIGHGVATTLAGLANTYATLANDGLRVPPRLVLDPPGPRAEPEQVIDPAHAEAITDALTLAVEGGTGVAAQVGDVPIAGKTGTARQVDPAGGYRSQYTNTFVGFAPANDPDVVVAVLLDAPTTHRYASQTAAPVFADLLEEVLEVRELPATTHGPSGR